MICLKCNTPNPDDSRFCSQCGVFMTIVPTAAAGQKGDTPTIAPQTGSSSKPTGSRPRDSMAATTASSMAGTSPGVLMGILPRGYILGNRYEVGDPLGMGGMGMVYRAQDMQLGVPVALKLIRGEYASNEQVITRFKQEINIARSVTHRNVARIFDLGDSDGVRYLTMEYIDGEDLAHIVEKSGPLSIERTISLLRQTCEALKEAHSVGVVHRDLKPHNIMLDANDGVHLMDFGIAMSSEVQGFTRTGALIGTPDYMSPEQAAGRKVDHRSDIYSLGVTLYEILTGDAPFRGGTPWQVIKKQIEERAHSIRRTRPEVPEWLDTLVLKCLEKDPALRYQSVGEILLDLDRQRAHLSARHYLPSRRVVGMAVAALLLVAAGVSLTVILRPRGPVAGSGDRVSVAILPFENQTGRAELDWLRTGLADNLVTDLGESKYFRVLSRERLSQIFDELKLTPESKLTSSLIKRIAEYGAVEAVMTGSFLSQGDQIRVNLRTLDPQSGENLKNKVVNGRESELFSMIDDLTRATKEMFELAPDRVRSDADLTIASARTSSVESASLYQKGVDLLYQGRNLEAIEPLSAAVRADKEYAMAHARLAEAHMRTGHDRDASEAIKAAMDRLLAGAENIPQADRTYIRALNGRIMHQPDDSIRAYQEILKNDPDDPFAAFSLGEVLEGTGDFSGAEEQYLKALKHDAKDPLLQFALGRVRIKAEHHEEALPELQKALTIYTEMGSEEGQGTILNAMGRAYDMLGRYDDALGYYGRSESIKRKIGDKSGLAKTLDNKAGLLQVQGRLTDAAKNLEEALALSREIGDTDGMARAFVNLGSLKEEIGDPEGMTKSYQEGLALRRTLKDRAEQVTCLIGLTRGNLYLGRISQAEENAAEAERIAREIDADESLAQIESDKALIEFYRGALDKAMTGQQHASKMWAAADRPDGVAETRYRLGLVHEATGEHAAARRELEAALASYKELGDRTNQARATLELSHVALMEGDQQKSLELLDQIGSTLSELDNPVLIAQAGLTSARIHASRGDRPAALAAAERTCAAAGRTRAVIPAIQCGLAKSLAAPAEDAVASALSASTRSSDSGLSILQAEADLALAQAYQRAGRMDQAFTRANVALAAARRLGLKQLERDAIALASRSK